MLRRFSWIDGALILTASIWGVNVVIVKLSLLSFNPIVFNSLRFILATVLSWGLLMATEPKSKLKREDMFTMALLGVVGHALYQVVFIYGINYTTAGNTSLLLATMPIWVALFSAYSAIEAVKLNTWLGLGCSVAGILLVVLGSGKALGFGAQTLVGDILIVSGTLLYATYTLRSKRLLSRYSPLQLSTYTMTSGTIGLVLVAAPNLLRTEYKLIPFQAWAGLVFSGVLAIVVGYYIWNSGVKLLGPTRTAVYGNLSPIIAMLTGWAALGERVSLPQFAGAALIISGLAVARQVPKQINPTIDVTKAQ